jgi:hypothetical protein
MSTFFARTLRSRFALLLSIATVCVLFGGPSHAAIIAPGQPVPGLVGDAFGWSRGAANSTYSGWDFFEAVAAPGFAGTPFTDSTPDIVGQFGTPSSISVGPGALGVGSGNAYSPFVALSFSSIVNSGTSGGNNTRIVAQFRTGGSELDYQGILLSTSTETPGTVAPSLMMETGRVALGGFGGDQVDYLSLWDLTSSQSAFRLDFRAASSSLSLQEFHLDTFVHNSAFITPSAVPEPGTLAVLGFVTGGGWMVRRLRRKKVGLLK